MKDSFITDDQNIMTQAKNYNKYLFSLLSPYVNGNILEIGAGIGNMTDMLLTNCKKQIQSITCIEQDKECYKKLEEKLSSLQIYSNSILGSFPEALDTKSQFDLICSFNVFEHIEDDNKAFVKCYNLLSPGGIMFAFVPAFQCIYGSMDQKLKHFRRYNKKEIIGKAKTAGFSVEKIRYCNFIGFLGWFVNNRILKIKSQKSNQVVLFDKIILPIQSKIEKYIEPRIGQNLYIVARK